MSSVPTTPSEPAAPRVVPLTPVARRGRPDLPVPLDELIGREAELSSLIQSLRSRAPRLIVLTGPGGVGKTRLALEAASEAADAFADGGVFVSLAPIRDPALLASTIAQAAGVRSMGEQPIAERLIEVLAARDLLLILDNFEHVAAAAPLVGVLLTACPRLVTLVTSRARLRLTGEHDVPIPPLAVSPEAAPGSAGSEQTGPDQNTSPVGPTGAVAVDVERQAPAIRLFVARAQAVDPAWRLTSARVEVVTDICQRLDGLPLAIELAAAQSRLLSPAALLARLDQRLPLLEAGRRDQPARLQTMRQAIAWSYDLLSPADQAVFRRLAVFLGGFDLEAASTVAGASLRQISGLVDQSLILPLVDLDEPRCTMLETIREFGLEQLIAAGEERDARDRHAAWFCDLAARLEPALFGEADQARALRRLETERANIRAAFAWLLAKGETESALRLMTRLVRFWFIRGYLGEGAEMMEAALAAAPTAPRPLRAWALLSLAMLWMAQHVYSRAETALAIALPLVEHGADKRGLGFARLCQAHLAFMHGDLVAVERLAEESERIADQVPNWWDVQGARFLRAKAALYRGNLDQAEETNRGLYEAAGSQEVFMLACSRHDRGTILARRGNYRGALSAFAASLRDLQELGERWNTPMSLDAAAAAAVALGEPVRAAQLFGHAQALRTQSGSTVLLPDQPAYDRAVATARIALGEVAFTAAWAEGATTPLPDLIAAINELAAGGAAMRAVTVPARTPRLSELTRRELEVLTLLVEGQSDPQIGALLSISPRTVESHVRHILTKLGVVSRTAAVALAVRQGLV